MISPPLAFRSGQALKLFNLPMQAYPELSEVETTLDELKFIYDIFREQTAAREEWAATLWAELDMSVMEKGMEEFENRLKKLPKELRQE